MAPLAMPGASLSQTDAAAITNAHRPAVAIGTPSGHAGRADRTAGPRHAAGRDGARERDADRGTVASMSDSVDLAIVGGTVVDGTGSTGRARHDRRRGRPTPAPRPRTRRSPSTSAAPSTPPDRVVAPGFIDLHSHGGLTILAEPRHEPKVRQGVTTEIVGVDGNGFAPFETARGPRCLRRARHRPRRRARHRLRLAHDRRVPGPLRRHGQRQRRHARRQQPAAHRRPRLGRRARRRQRHRPDARDSSATPWPRARVGLSSGLDYPPGSFATTEELAALTRTAGRARRLLPHPRALSARRPLPRPVPRGDRDRAPRRGAGPHHPLLSPPDPSRARRTRCSRSSTTRAPRAST